MNLKKKTFDEQKIWGMSTSLDLYRCCPDKIRDAEYIKQYVKDLCDLIEMKRFGECLVIHFGEDPKVSGFSMTQLIETSLISGHFANNTNAAYLDIFSCKWYDVEKIVKFSKLKFKSDYAVHRVTKRL